MEGVDSNWELLRKFRQELRKPLETDNGYKLKATHFKIGKGLHAGTYYHLKKFFEIGRNCDIVSKLLVDTIVIDGNSTLISYGVYTNLLLRKTVNNLSARYPGYKLNYTIAYHNKNNELSFQFEEELLDNVIIILPAVNTLGRFFAFQKQLRKWITKKYGKKENEKIPVIHPTSYSTIYFKSNIRFSVGLEWHLDESEKTIMIDSKDEVRSVKYLMNLNCDCYREDDCPFCFFEKNKDKNSVPQDERYFFPVNVSTETPKLIFNLPHYADESVKDNSEYENELKFDDVFKTSEVNYPNYYGHTKSGDLSFTNYIRADFFYRLNDVVILPFFIKKIRKVVKQFATKEIIIMTPRREISSRFLEDLVEHKDLQDLQISIISYKPFNEYAENFEAFYGKYLHNKKTKLDKDTGENIKKVLLVYYSDLIDKGKEFKELNTFLKKSKDDQGFDMCWTLIDRSDKISKIRILRRLKSASDFVSFFKLNVPVQAELHLGNPIENRFQTLQQILDYCHLDALKLRIIKEMSECEPMEIETLDFDSVKDSSYYYFLNEQSNIVENYKSFKHYAKNFVKGDWMLLKLKLFHEASSFLNSIEYKTSESTNLVLSELIDHLTDKISQSFFVKSEHANFAAEKNIVYDNIVKLFSRSPFVSFELIYKQIFKYCIERLDQIVDTLDGVKEISFSQFRDLKFFIRRTVELNSNYIISEKFIGFLKKTIFDEKLNITKVVMAFDAKAVAEKDLYHKEKEWGFYTKARNSNHEYIIRQIGGFRYFLVYCYKEIILANPSKAIELEGLINSQNLLPPGINGQEIDVKNFLQNPYYAFGRAIKTENIGIINIFKNWYLNNNLYLHDEIADCQAHVLNTYLLKSDRFVSAEHELLIKFINKSKHFGEDQKLLEIKHSIAWTIATAVYLKRIKNDKSIASGNVESNIKTILESVVKIASPQNNDSNTLSLNYLLLVEYKRIGDNSEFYTLSSNPKDFGDENPDKKGLAYNVFNGIRDSADGNIQTFLPLVKLGELETKNSILSFKDNFYSSNDNEIIRIKSAFRLDLEKYVVIRNAKILQYFRLAEINYEKSTSPISKAVLVLCSNESPSIDNLKDFQNIEKMRLLLLIKEDILDYINLSIDNYTFSEMLQNKRKLVYAKSMNHGLDGYFSILKNYINSLDTEVSYLIMSAIKGQVLSKFGFSITEQMKDKIMSKKGWADSIPIAKHVFKNRIEIICHNENIGGKIVNMMTNELHDEAFPLKIERVMFDVVLTELLINMKKNYPDVFPGSPYYLFSVRIWKDRWVFLNKVEEIPTVRHSYDIEPFHGLYMIKKILKDLNYPSLDIKFSETKMEYALTINLKKHD